MTDTLKAVGLVIAGAVIGLLVSASSGGSFGGVYNNVTPDFSEGITVDGTTVISGSRSVSAVNGTYTGTLTTDELAVTDGTFCIDGFATSTATAVKITASTTATIEGTDGVLVYTYGSCN